MNQWNSAYVQFLITVFNLVPVSICLSFLIPGIGWPVSLSMFISSKCSILLPAKVNYADCIFLLPLGNGSIYKTPNGGSSY